MINFQQDATNKFVIYSDLTLNTGYYLIELKYGWDNYTYSAILAINKQNVRFTEFELTLTTGTDDPINSILNLPAPFNYDYKIWNIPSPVLDPTGGILIEKGQAFLEKTDSNTEISFTFFKSDNENAKSDIYYSPLTINFSDETQNFIVVKGETSYTNNFLIGFLNGFTKEWTYVNPFDSGTNTKYYIFGVTFVSNPALADPQNGVIYLQPNGSYDYKIWRTPTSSLDPLNGDLLYEAQFYFFPNMIQEIKYTTYISDNEQAKRVIYYTQQGTLWETTDKYWEFADWDWEQQ